MKLGFHDQMIFANFNIHFLIIYGSHKVSRTNKYSSRFVHSNKNCFEAPPKYDGNVGHEFRLKLQYDFSEFLYLNCMFGKQILYLARSLKVVVHIDIKTSCKIFNDQIMQNGVGRMFVRQPRVFSTFLHQCTTCFCFSIFGFTPAMIRDRSQITLRV